MARACGPARSSTHDLELAQRDEAPARARIVGDFQAQALAAEVVDRPARMRATQNSAGASRFPSPADTVTLSQRGGVIPGSGATRFYQTYYRNAAASFCTPETFNATNGIEVVW